MKRISIFIAFAIAFTACRVNQPIDWSQLPESRNGLYILCEGNMGSNKATIDYYDFQHDTIYRNIYPAMNPDVVMELGDVGNDIATYGSKLYAAINISAKVEVMDLHARRIGQVDIPNCRNIVFDGGYAYVSSYAGPVDVDNPGYAQRGFVAKIDTATLQVVDTCQVGFQPDNMVIHDGLMYVANSGGYMAPVYDSTLSVIRLSDFREVRRIPVAINISRLCLDGQGKLWVASAGDYYERPAQVYTVDLATERVTPMGFAASCMCLSGNDLYYIASEFSYTTYEYRTTYGIIDTRTGQRLTDRFICDGSEKQFVMPYSLFIERQSGDIYVTDARDYVTPGVLYRYSKDGVQLGHWRTGDIPGHIARIQTK